ncbi:hypothetical protein [Streptomyces sp. RerS4]|uniref:hypothetical protein n=1 Tax=Streptomyces sp. RerS4 TaxID=2942449 RepID=UPI00201CAC1F|nr:hypothetical protein [Streptomyces sp. RerS4]UQW99761.1 hypothetical protein M4D82_03820 [Streptomyces sp. RerS4]
MGTREHQTSRAPGGGRGGPAYPAAGQALISAPQPPAPRPPGAGAGVEVVRRAAAEPVAVVEAPAPDRWRYARHLERLATVAGVAGEVGEAAAVAAVLRDPDPVMAESAVVTHLDRRALRLLPGAEFSDWARALGPVLDGREFPARRLREWSLLRAIAAGAPWSPAALTAASDWCQRTAAQTLAAPDALALLAASARTRRVRNTAAQRLRRRAPN